ncbi:hypothetical protein OSB04_000436 [Centaurea solstitialis]|uniref:TCP domain-containing protein n=1 Tax=Centaurea solstitialis TaxID=347529 RepID=A0AA38WS38_9ASTR|nr:hypothetical protein OSB04_000436 [Centaurea solstitialis]
MKIIGIASGGVLVEEKEADSWLKVPEIFVQFQRSLFLESERVDGAVDLKHKRSSFCASYESNTMNISNLREPDYETTKQEGGNNDGGKMINIVPKPNMTTSSWSRLKDPRIVRVSRAFGGKDRHSKVCTVRGLRDRRVRLSVPTAIQLYDLQDRLGLNQPSKVVDWLLDAAKHEIDELPPLQIPPGSFAPGLQAMLSASTQSQRIEEAKTSTSNGLNWEDFWNPDKSKVTARETNNEVNDQEPDQDQEDSRNKHHPGTTFVQPSNFFGRNPNSSYLPGLLNNVVPSNSFLKWDPSSLSLSQFGSYGSSVENHQQDHVHNFNMNVATINHHPSSQLLLYPPPQQPPPPPPPQTQSYFPSHDHNSGEFDPKQQLSFQMLSSSSSSSHNPLSSSSNFTPPLYTINQGMRPFHLSMNPKFFSSDDDNGGHDQSDK